MLDFVEIIAVVLLVTLFFHHFGGHRSLPVGHVSEGGKIIFDRGDDKNGIYVDATINGTKGVFQIDTGASNTALTASFARRAKLPYRTFPTEKVVTWSGSTREYYATNVTIDVQGARATGSKVSVRDDDNPDDDSDGLIGLDFLSRFKVTLTDKTLTFEELDRS